MVRQVRGGGMVAPMRGPSKHLPAAVVGTILLAGCGGASDHTTAPVSPGEPESAAEIAQDLSGNGAGFQRKQVSAASCRQTTAGHWTCAVRFGDGTTGTVLAVWYGRAQTLGLSLASPTSTMR
jgi:hypothetical protein